MYRNIFILCLILSSVFCTSNLYTAQADTAEQTIQSTQKQKLLDAESTILDLLKERHALAGEAINLRSKILDAKKRAVPENADEVRMQIDSYNSDLSEKNKEINEKNIAIKKETTELKAMLHPKAATSKSKKGSSLKRKKSHK